MERGTPVRLEARTTPTLDRVRTALLAALCAAVGYLLAGVPNVELISAAVFTCGVLRGVARGALIGLIAETIFAGFNPNGVSPPPLLVAQIAGFALIGAAGGAVRPVLDRLTQAGKALVAAACGLGLTLVYDVLTNFAVWLTVRETASLAAIVLGGLSFPFPLAHAGLNTVGFGLVVPAVLGAVRRRSAA
jgi:hypothetical protein